MLVACKAALSLVGLCCCIVSAPAQQCSCTDNKTCIAREGTVKSKSSVESHPCQAENVICCENLSTDSKSLQDPRVAPGGGCGRKRFSSEMSAIEGKEPFSRTAFHGEFPWMVAILNKNLTLRCGGTLISPKVVLTAAHCLNLERKLENLFIRAGAYFTSLTNKVIPSQLQSVQEIFYHSGFDEKNISNDIAIIVLKQPMELNAVVDVICIPEDGQEIIATDCFMTGFGFNSKNDSHSNVLKKMKYTYEFQEYCREVMKTADALKFYHESNICVVGNEENRARHGDGGGPLFCPLQADPNRMVQIGIVSWGVSSKGKYPTAFTSVEYYLPWLRKKIKQLS